jgi:hypothetical protein
MSRAFPNFDPTWAMQLAEFCAQAYDEYVARSGAGPDVQGQVDYALAADYALDCACATYALGATAGDVHVWLARAAYNLAQVFRLRGTAAALPMVVVVDGETFEPAPPAGPDYSLTNSRRGLLAMYLALVAGDRDLVAGIAGLIGDPPSAGYIGPDSEVCTPEEQQLAYGVKALLLGQDAVAAFYAAGLGGARPSIRHQAAMVVALVGRDRDAFLAALRDALATHAVEASDRQNTHEPRRLMYLPGLGLAALAVGTGLVERGQLPAGDVHLPLALMESQDIE